MKKILAVGMIFLSTMANAELGGDSASKKGSLEPQGAALMDSRTTLHSSVAAPEKPGSTCGLRVTGDGRVGLVRRCQGRDPVADGCPAGYSINSYPGFDYVWHHTCVKQEPRNNDFSLK